MTFTLIAHSGAACTGSNPSLPHTGSLNTTGADLIVVAAFGEFLSGSSTLTDNHGNTYTLAKYETTGSGRDEAVVFYCINPTVGSAHTWSGGSAFPGFDSYSVMAFSGAATGGFDQVNGAALAGNGSTKTQQTGSITPTVNGELVVAFFGADDPACSGGTPYAVDSGFTLVDSIIDVPGGLFGGCSAYLVQATAAPVNPTMTRSVATGSGFHSSSVIVSFKPAGGGTQALFGTMQIALRGTATPSGTAALAGRSLIATKAQASIKGTAPLAGRAALSLRGVAGLVNTLPLIGRLTTALRGSARMSPKAALSGSAKIGVTARAAPSFTAHLAGRTTIAVRGLASTAGPIIALVGRLAIQLTGRAGIAGKTMLAGSARIQTTGRAALSARASLAGISRVAVKGKAGLKAAAALGARTSFAVKGKAIIAGKVALGGATLVAVAGAAQIGRLVHVVALSGATLFKVTCRAALTVFEPSVRVVAAIYAARSVLASRKKPRMVAATTATRTAATDDRNRVVEAPLRANTAEADQQDRS